MEDLQAAADQVRFEHQLGESVARCLEVVQSGSALRAECSVLGKDGRFYTVRVT